MWAGGWHAPQAGEEVGVSRHDPSQGGQWVVEELGQCWGRPGREALEGARLHACNSSHVKARPSPALLGLSCNKPGFRSSGPCLCCPPARRGRGLPGLSATQGGCGLAWALRCPGRGQRGGLPPRFPRPSRLPGSRRVGEGGGPGLAVQPVGALQRAESRQGRGLRDRLGPAGAGGPAPGRCRRDRPPPPPPEWFNPAQRSPDVHPAPPVGVVHPALAPPPTMGGSPPPLRLAARTPPGGAADPRPDQPPPPPPPPVQSAGTAFYKPPRHVYSPPQR